MAGKRGRSMRTRSRPCGATRSASSSKSIIFLPRMSARDNVELPAVYAGEPRATRRVRADALLDRLGLGDRRGHRPSQLSGGQQQRVGIARALMNGGLVLLADEPTGALDSRTGDQTLALFRTLCDEGHTVLMVTHDQHVAAQADRIVEMVDGRIRADRTVVKRDLGNARPTPRKVDESGWIRYAGDALRNAAQTIVSHRLRNALTMLGIVVGIASVILSVAFWRRIANGKFSERFKLAVQIT